MVVSIANVNEPFEHVEVPESGAVVLCIAVWGPVTETVHVLVQTTDSGIALGKSSYIIYGALLPTVLCTHD